jgi:hemerythrin HHE cation binding domain-containing protein
MMTPRIPKPLTEEHEELHADLVKLTRARGKVGEAARAVAALLHPHFVKEEEYALPPLGLLAALAARPPTPEMRAVLPMTDRLRAELPQMLSEHKAVLGALRRLAAAGRREKKPAAVRFAKALTLHALSEEQVLYPAAILVGEYIRARTGGSAP